MKIRDALKLGISVSAALALGILVQPASASVVGHLTFANCAGQGVTVTLSLIDFLPAGGGTGCIDAGAGTTITFTGAPGAIAPADVGTINDLGTANAGFITFPGVMFNLSQIGPGSTNFVCNNTDDPTAAACSVGAGSPFVLTPEAQVAGVSVTGISLNVSGLASDSTSGNSPWAGIFTTQLSGFTPFAVQQAILAPGGSITATFSFDGQASAGTSTPEPVSMALIGGGLIALASLRRRKSRT
jgi:hypothetical protein